MNKYEKILDKVLIKQYDLCDLGCDCYECIFEAECNTVFDNERPTGILTKYDFVDRIKELMIKESGENE